MGKIFVLLILTALTSPSSAEMDAASQEALTKTQKVLTDPVKREEAFTENPKMREGERAANQLVGGNSHQKEKIYAITAQVLETLAQKSNGDLAAMQEIITRAQQNPEKFMQEYFSEEQKAQVRQLANEIEKDKKIAPPKQQAK
jgi:hypothetical protein